MHCITRSLGKNLFLLHDILNTVKSLPDIIAISETQLNENTSVNLHIPGYLFVRTDSKSHACGVGLYISDQLVFSRRRVLDISRDGIESCGIEILRKRQKNVVIGSLHTYNTRYAASQNLYKSRVRTNTGKQTISYMASIFCHNIPSYLKNLNVYQFSKQIKLYLFSEQLENTMK